jgi:hypothetical protein
MNASVGRSVAMIFSMCFKMIGMGFVRVRGAAFFRPPV